MIEFYNDEESKRMLCIITTIVEWHGISECQKFGFHFHSKQWNNVGPTATNKTNFSPLHMCGLKTVYQIIYYRKKNILYI